MEVGSRSGVRTGLRIGDIGIVEFRFSFAVCLATPSDMRVFSNASRTPFCAGVGVGANVCGWHSG